LLPRRDSVSIAILFEASKLYQDKASDSPACWFGVRFVFVVIFV
jgi:hypothetical protein